MFLLLRLASNLRGSQLEKLVEVLAEGEGRVGEMKEMEVLLVTK